MRMTGAVLFGFASVLWFLSAVVSAVGENYSGAIVDFTVGIITLIAAVGMDNA